MLRLWKPGDLPTGVVIGSAIIAACDWFDPAEPRGPRTMYRWHLAEVRRAPRPAKPTRHPQPAWFVPYGWRVAGRYTPAT